MISENRQCCVSVTVGEFSIVRGFSVYPCTYIRMYVQLYIVYTASTHITLHFHFHLHSVKLSIRFSRYVHSTYVDRNLSSAQNFLNCAKKYTVDNFLN